MFYIATNYPEKDIYTIKKENSYLAISTPQLKFLDISIYVAPGSSYSQFLKACGCNIPKGFFLMSGLILLINSPTHHYLKWMTFIPPCPNRIC